MTELQQALAPSEEQASSVLKKYLPSIKSVRRTKEGVSTYVYRVETGPGTCYARFLPEDATFGAEVLAHRLAEQAGVPVPEVLIYLPREHLTGLSLMVVSEMPGESAQGLPEGKLRAVLRQAGQALSLLHTIPVDGFGWIDREYEDRLKGEFPSFSTYFTEFWEHDLHSLAKCGLPEETVTLVRGLMEEALPMLTVDQAVLVHGDLSLDHIYHLNGRFTGFIDFGEIRGNNPLFDLGDFLQSDSTPGKLATSALLEGYEAAHPLGEKGRRAAALEALAFSLRFIGLKAGTEAEGFWLERLKAVLALLENWKNY